MDLMIVIMLLLFNVPMRLWNCICLVIFFLFDYYSFSSLLDCRSFPRPQLLVHLRNSPPTYNSSFRTIHPPPLNPTWVDSSLPQPSTQSSLVISYRPLDHHRPSAQQSPSRHLGSILESVARVFSGLAPTPFGTDGSTLSQRVVSDSTLHLPTSRRLDLPRDYPSSNSPPSPSLQRLHR